MGCLKKFMKKFFFLILPDIRSCHNVGAMFRTADACGVDQIFLVGYTPHPPRKEIDKVSLGAEKSVKWKPYKNLKTLVNSLKKKNIAVIGLEKSEQSVPLETFFFKNIFDKHVGVALVVGNEVEGIAPDILSLCDAVIHISMYGKKESLNVSIAGGIALYEIQKQRTLF